MFKEMIVWFEKSESELFRYRLFQDLSNGKFFVKSADGFQNEFNDKHAKQQDADFVYSLFQNGITEFAEKSFDTIGEAVAAFNSDFE